MMNNNEIYIWDIKWVDYLDKKATFYTLLSTKEKRRVASYQFEKHRSQFIVTRAILRILISHLLNQGPKEIEFEYTSLGKPMLVNHPYLKFSVSHARHKALYAFGLSYDVGVDVEYQKHLPYHNLVKRYFSIKENQVFNGLPRQAKQEAFFKGWVQKEAIIKATGLGFTLPVNQIEVEFDQHFPGVVSFPSQINSHVNWHLHEVKTDCAYKAVVALSTPCIAIHYQHFTHIPVFTL